jgi:enterochelin esterase family protein
VLGGASLGGLQSTFTAMEHPDVVHNVLSVSGSFWYGPDLPDQPEWLTSRIGAEPVLPLRLYQQIGRLEDGPLSFAPGVTHLGANRRFRDAALARGYDLQYDELGTAHDVCAFRVATLRGLQHLLPR